MWINSKYSKSFLHLNGVLNLLYFGLSKSFPSLKHKRTQTTVQTVIYYPGTPCSAKLNFPKEFSQLKTTTN